MLRCEIIAEVGLNHGGDMWIAKHMIEEAKLCGADTVKFQYYDPNKLLNKDDFTSTDWKTIQKSKLSFDDVKNLYKYCQVVGVEFLCSAFDYEHLEELEWLGVSRHKIASRSVFDKGYVEAVKATGKPYIVSMGWLNRAHEFNSSLFKTWDMFEDGHKLYCVSHYPTRLEDIKLLSDEYGCAPGKGYDGFSDHTIGTTAAKVAIVRGATIIEKHFTLYKHMPGPDHVCSATPGELRDLCRFRDEFERMNYTEEYSRTC